MKKKTIIYQDVNLTIKELYDKIAPYIIKRNQEIDCTNDTPNDIMFVITNEYNLTCKEYEELKELLENKF